ncbi:polysaccharide deacetylase family protein [Nocardioides mesophilus]|uniref:polysaccharide deacetylase family protein n=1 Tax=Nocardioides mesophilus TaxID=433659 RepID=UPI001FEB7AB5|nr:polysaccharide deacetylase family protein [Nocardioides mesophilus]
MGPDAHLRPPPAPHRPPRLSGISGSDHIALTYDDGPDPASTPSFLEMLERQGVSATFFLLGEFVSQNRSLVAEMSAAGHELAVHGWDHQCLAWKPPGRLTDELRRTRHLVEDLTGIAVLWFRPPYGVATGRGLLAARRAGLRPVLWSAWGRDWSRRATPDSIATKVLAAVRPGGTVLLHDTDRTAAPGSWRGTLAASDVLLDRWHAQEVSVGPLREHWDTTAP